MSALNEELRKSPAVAEWMEGEPSGMVTDMRNIAARFGFASALVSFVAAAGYSIVQVLQILGIIRWPFDAIGIYGFSLLIAAPFMLAILALCRSTADEKKIWSQAALLFAMIYTTYVTLMYTIQLASALPLALRGYANPLFAVERYSLFWSLDGLGYVCMGISTLLAVPVFARRGVERWVRRFFLANGLFTPVIALVYWYPVFSTKLLLLASPWVVTGPGSILLLAIYFKRRTTSNRARPTLASADSADR
jgi:hypothetical protein